MSAPSTVVATRRALVKLLSARPGLAGVQVAYAHPGPTAEDELIFFGDADGNQETSGLRAGRRNVEETYTLDAFVAVVADGATQEEADVRLAELWGELAAALATDPRAGTDFLASVVVDTFTTDAGMTERGTYAGVRLGLTVKARLTHTTPES